VKRDPHISSYRAYLAAAVALVTFIVYLPALHNEFVYWDDNLYVFENPNIRSLDAAFFQWAFLEFHVSNWHPLTWISHAVDYAIWGLNPLGHHLTNIILHAVNTALVVVLALKLLEFVREQSALKETGSFLNNRMILIAAGATGLLFGIHPVHVESVAWISERKDLLCALFFLLSVIWYANYVSYKTYKTYMLTLGFFVLALFSKPMAVTLPVALLILDWYPFNRIRSPRKAWGSIVEKLPFIFLSLFSSLLTLLAQREGNSMAPLDFVPLSTRLLVAVQSLAVYIQNMLLPLNLIPLYPYPKDVSLFSFKYASTLLLVMGATAICAVLARKRKIWLSVWSFYVIMLIPVLGIIQVGNQPMADRYAYLPSLGPFLLAGAGVAWISEKAFREKRRGLFITGATIIIALLLVCCLSILTVRQTAIWRNSISLWTYVIEKEPERIPLAYNNRGMVFYKAGMFDRALADFDQAIGMDPEYAKAYYNRGSTYDTMGQLDKAIVDYRKTISLDPYYYEAHYFLDQALKKTGPVDNRTR
jgi:tetratricopeptide (TPR) repeat protein